MVKKRRKKEKKSDQQGSTSVQSESPINHPIWSSKRRERERRRVTNMGQRVFRESALSTKIHRVFFKMGEYFSIYFKFESILILKFKPLPNEKKRRPSNMVKKRREKDGRERDQQGSKSVLRALSKEKYIECIYMGKHFSIYFKFDRILISKRIP